MAEKKETDVVKACIDLIDCKRELQFNQRDLEEEIKRDQQLIQNLSSEIRTISRRSHALQRQLAAIDDVSLDKDEALISSLLSKQKLYEELFCILQQNQKYLVSLIDKVSAGNITDFVNTVLFDIYGDPYDYEEENLLLTLFQMVIKQSFDECQDIKLFFIQNTNLNKLLTEYTARGHGLGVLREILEKPIREMMVKKLLNCEIDPIEVHGSIAALADNQYINRLITPRIKQLENICSHFIERIVETVDCVPFGIRWICRQLTEMTQNKFPNADGYQINGLVGKYIYLQFYKPIIVLPECIGIIEEDKLSKMMRRNLHLVAQILQGIFSGDPFEDEYECLNQLSTFTDRYREDIQKYFVRLIDINPLLTDRSDVDKLLENTKRRGNVIQISSRNICLIHRLLLKYKNEWNQENDESDPISKILMELESLSMDSILTDNNSINISLNRLSDGRITGDEITTLFESKSHGPFINNIRNGIRTVLLNNSIPQIFFDKYRNSLKEFLYYVSEWASIRENIKISKHVQGVITDIDQYIKSKQSVQVNEDDIFNNFLFVYINEIREIIQRIDGLHLKVIGIEKSRDAAIEQLIYLQNKLANHQWTQNGAICICYNVENLDCLVCGYLKEYLLVKYASNYPIELNYIFIQYLMDPAINRKPIKFNHKTLVKDNVIVDVNQQILAQTRANFNNLIYCFGQIDITEFELEIKYKVGFGVTISPFPEPFSISLSKLLEMKEANQSKYEMVMVYFDVVTLINLLKISFRNNTFCLCGVNHRHNVVAFEYNKIE